MPAHACIRLAVLPMPAEPAYGRIFGDCLRQFASSFAYAGSRLHTAHATLLAHGQYALLARYCLRQYALFVALLASPIRALGPAIGVANTLGMAHKVRFCA